MSFLKNKQKRKIIIIAVSVTLVFAVLIGGCAVYLTDYYRADEEALSAFAPMYAVDACELENGNIVFEAKDTDTGFVFYPGGKVDKNAYKPLMAELSSRGITCIIVDMPFNLAVLDINAADGICDEYPEIKRWYIGGHSLGGSMAASYVSEHTDIFDGLVLLGAYSTADISETSLKVLSVYGSEDKVMNREKYEGNKSNLPDSFTETIIDGGCHAGFGMYGAQDGDGVPKITNEVQITITADAVLTFINNE